MQKNTARGFSAIIVVLAIVILSGAGFLIYYKNKIQPNYINSDVATAMKEYCVDTKKFDDLLAEAYEKNDDQFIVYLEDLRDKVNCSLTVEKKAPTEIIPPQPPVKNSKYAEYQYDWCTQCVSDDQTCEVCWSNKKGEKICCIKTLEETLGDDSLDHVKSVCKEGDRFVDPGQVARCRED